MTTRSRVLSAFVVVLALGAAGCGSSDPAGVPVTADTVPPAAVLDVAPTVTTTGIHISWVASSETDLAGYRVHRGVGAGETVLVGTVSTNEYVDTDVQRGILYRYEIAAFDQAGNVGPLVETASVSFNTETRGRRDGHTGD